MRERVLQLLAMSCWHRHLSQPFSLPPARNSAANSYNTTTLTPDRKKPYVVCLDCGRHFDYDWTHMQIVK